ncbi:TonB-dependent receptor [Acidovorax sp. HDW3]|uniref:TonB-dependent receptor domain-containing protein n=1 Tax=Acidovorax sp. HDW3 TaxID=2714923 RepID=UPI0014076A1B|nr:TonB-dependent receptor [Acidovorax sp. HDW3]QIL43643.1 TonB-dependent receptor [Acidovorax sp. HDW3]
MMNFDLGARLPLRVCALALAAAAACSAQAHNHNTAPTLPETVVAATRTAQPLTDVVADVSIVDRDTIERSGATGLGDVLARLPGIEMGRSGGQGGTTSLFVRGAETRFTAVYIDGVRVDSQAGSGGTSWEAIPLEQIERIEVLRGPAAAVYGSDAIAGVIQIFTKKGEQGVAPYVGVGAGSYGTYRAQAGVSGASGAVDYALGLARESSKGFNAKKDGNPDRDDYHATSASGRLGWQLNKAHRLEGNFLYNDTDSGYDVSKTADDRSLRRLQTLGLNWQSQWSNAYSTRLAVTDSRDRYETLPSPYRTDTQSRNYLFFNELRLGVHQLTAALERREDELTNMGLDSSPRKRAQNALALGYGLRQGAHTLQLNARHDQDSEFGGKTTGSAAYAYEFVKNWRATASAGTAFKAPTLYQRFSLYGDDSLRPETSRNVELGLKWAEGASQFSATLYRNNVSNLIDWQGNIGSCTGNSGPWGGCYANVGKARYQGLTLAGAYRLGSVNLRGSLDLQNPQNLDTGKQLGRRAKQHGVLGADTLVAGWTLGAEAQASGRRYDTNANTTELGGYTLLNLYASTRLARDYQVVVRLDNLADKDYALARNYATAGRSFFVGLKWAPAR